MRMHTARSLWAVQARSSRRILLFQNSNEPRGGGGGGEGGAVQLIQANVL